MKAVGALLSLVVIGLGLGVYWWMSLADLREEAARLPELRKQAESMGIPFTWDSPQLESKVPDTENASSAVRVLAGAVQAAGLTERRPRDDGWAMATHKKNPDIWTAAQKAASYPKCDFGRDWSDPTAVNLKELVGIDAAVRYLSQLAVDQAKSREFDAARTSLKTAARLCEFTLSDQVPVSLTLFARQRRTITSAISEIATNADRDADTLAFCRSAMDALPAIPTFAEGLHRHGAYLIWGSRRPEELVKTLDNMGDSIGMEGGVTVKIPRGRYAAEAMEARTLAYWTEFLKIVDGTSSYGEKLKRYRELAERTQNPEERPAAAITLLEPAQAALISSMAQVQISEELVRHAIEVLEIRRRTGSFPAALPASLPVRDPFSGAPYKYSTLGSGFRIYSVGEDQIDQGGRRWNGLGPIPGAQGESDDYGFCYNPSQSGPPPRQAVAITKGLAAAPAPSEDLPAY